MSWQEEFDLLIVGGGINGAGIARDAAGRGLRVALCEKGDLAGATSSASTKLIHGGLRYLETFEFRLVHEALVEREVLLRVAPHIVRPMRFVLPHNEQMRPAWMIRLGLFIYDHLGGRKLLPASRMIALTGKAPPGPLKPEFTKAFVYSDCWVDDARLVILNAMDAAERGALIMTRTECVAAHRDSGRWQATLRAGNGDERSISARVVVNATGPWAASILGRVFGIREHDELRLVKGSHFVVPRLFAGEDAYILQNTDGRVVFVIPYEHRYSLIGTTEVDFQGDPAEAGISPREIDYLCTCVNRYFATRVSADDVVWGYAGVRPLQDEGETKASKVTRDYDLDVDGDPPLLSVFGGKITTYRKLAEHALEKLAGYFSRRLARPWTELMPLPGGDIGKADFNRFLSEFTKAHPWLPENLAYRYGRAYGTRAAEIIGTASSLSGLGEHIGGGLYEAEADYLVRREWARTAGDILWRRSKLGLHITDEGKTRLEHWLDARKGNP